MIPGQFTEILAEFCADRGKMGDEFRKYLENGIETGAAAAGFDVREM